MYFNHSTHLVNIMLSVILKILFSCGNYFLIEEQFSCSNIKFLKLLVILYVFFKNLYRFSKLFFIDKRDVNIFFLKKKKQHKMLCFQI